ncbi:ABC transporter ATP-binding protein [Paenibacillus sediminis]|uniref:ABC-2 type transport system ATP-binding protein n=1 Tax=Paenibacillus sediminis TaxID=664909 RepID=A0ABS4H683_9BACL|nr:ABC transporter ATP-binding protein [Paenibacillus sediminis]MBP1938034.1 ABC-2 type transport system ATP-binding protein [Paenibacillus sediminis]
MLERRFSKKMDTAAEVTVLDVKIKEAGYEAGHSRIRDVSLTVKAGQLVGLIGPNGAGKSTTIKTILNLLTHAIATVQFSGPNQKYAYIPERPVFYETLTLWEHLELAAASSGMTGEHFKTKAELLLAKFRMTEVRDDLPVSFSKGMQQKMMLMIGFLIEPDIYIVDEPFIGLDPRATKDFLTLLDDERKRGAGVLMSTHVLDTAEKICDTFVLLSEGKVVAEGNLDQIRQASGLEDASLFDCFDALT